MADARFSLLLAAGTAAEHEGARSAPFVDALLTGRLNLDGYAALVAQHYFIYRELEQGAQRMDADSVARRFLFDELARLPSLEADLAHLLGPTWRERITPTAATVEYCERIREVCANWAGGFVAHHYTRYLGDLSGGRIVHAILRRTYDLPDGVGTTFYEFAGIEKPKVFKDRYRELLDAVPWDELEQQRVVDEAVLAYRHNQRVFADLGEDLDRFVA